MAEVICILCVLCCFLIVFGKENYTVTVSYNATVTMNCSATSVIKILNITVNENSKCKPMECILPEEEENAIKASCDDQHACNISSNIANSCLLDLGYLNYEYACKVIAHSCNFDNDWCDWTISPDANDMFRWKYRGGMTATSGTGPLGDHSTGSGYYAYTEASRGSHGDLAKLKSVGITSSPYQCLSFWYHMRGDDIGSLRVYQIYSAQDEDMLIWTVNGEQGTGWIYQAINLTYKNDLFKIMFEGVRSDGNMGDIALDDITITNSHCEDLRSRCQLSCSDQCTMNSTEEPLFEYKEECTEINQPISLSCSNQYLTVDHDEFIFDPELEFCHDVYMSSKTSLCNNTHDSEICVFNLHQIKQSYPECLSRYSMTIDYTCEANLPEKKKNSFVAADILMILVSTLVFTIVASLVIIALVCYRHKKAKHLKTQQNTTTIERIDVCDYNVINYNAMTDISMIKIHEKGNGTHTTHHHPQNIKTLLKKDQNICTKCDSLSTNQNSVDHIYESGSIHKNQYESLTNQRESDNHTYESPEYKLQRDINTSIEQENTICNKYETLSHNQTSVEHIYESDLIHTNQYEPLTRQRESDKHSYESTEPAQAQ